MKVILRSLILSFLLVFSPYDILNAMEECPHCGDLREDCLTARPRPDGTASKRTATNKWYDEVTPKRGWTCTSVEDLGVGNSLRCQMCDLQDVRYVHNMTHGTHPRQPLNLRVGCDCSGYMEGRFDDKPSILKAIKDAESKTEYLTNLARKRTKAFRSSEEFRWEPRDEWPRNYDMLFLTKGGKKFPGAVMTFKNEDESYSYNVNGPVGHFSKMNEAQDAAIQELRRLLDIS